MFSFLILFGCVIAQDTTSHFNSLQLCNVYFQICKLFPPILESRYLFWNEREIGITLSLKYNYQLYLIHLHKTLPSIQKRIYQLLTIVKYLLFPFIGIWNVIRSFRFLSNKLRRNPYSYPIDLVRFFLWSRRKLIRSLRKSASF